MSAMAEAKAGEKVLLLGNEAIARGAMEAGLGMFACYPGTPSSEVAEALVEAAGACRNGATSGTFVVEYSVNEKVAMEVACGAALSGARSMVAMKHVGLNVAADPLFTAAYIGMPGGLVVLSADDPGCHSSQNEQDNRQYARFAGLPCLEPVSAQEALDMTRYAFDMAAGLEQPVLLRTTTRISHMRGPVTCGGIAESPARDFARAPMRFVPVPAVARKRHVALAEHLRKAAEIAEKCPFNTIKRPESGKSRYGIVASGPARAYLADALETCDFAKDVAVFELGMTWPLPAEKLGHFLLGCEKVLVLEEGAPLLENDIRALAQKTGAGCDIAGKDGELGEFGEYSTRLVAARLARWLGCENPVPDALPARDLPGRPPNLCPGCAHRSAYYAARKVFGDDAVYSSDIGCYTLGLVPPLKAADFLVCMGSSVSAGSGFARGGRGRVVAFIGDSTFFHSGMTGLANAVFNNHDLLLVILDNGTTAMTGHQPNPGMLQEKLGENATHLDIENIVRGLGVTQFAAVRGSNLKALLAAFEEMRDQKGVRVILAQEPCMLYARRALGKKRKTVAVVKEQGQEVERCFRELACPAFMKVEGKFSMDENLCSGCMLCLQIAPGAFAAKALVKAG